jgi:hypothetical protein
MGCNFFVIGRYKYMKTKFLLSIITVFSLSLSFSIFNGRVPHLNSDEKGKIEYETKDNLYDGHYCSYYKNGNKKCEGQFINNNKTGKWVLYDSLGGIKVKRTYKNNFEYKERLTYTANGNFTAAQRALGPVKYNQKGFIDFFNFPDSAVIISKRIWRTIWADPACGLFAKNKFIHLLADSVAAGKYTLFQTDELRDSSKRISIARLLDTANYQIAGYKIKEDWFFDQARNIAETRIIAICPVAESKIDDDAFTQVDLGWFYYPDLRAGMAKLKADHNFYPVYIKSVDDILFFRNFQGEIYKESNIGNRELSDYTATKDMDKERHRIEMSLLEMEEDAWLSTFK